MDINRVSLALITIIGVCHSAATAQNNVTSNCSAVQLTLHHGTIHSFNKDPLALGSTIFFTCSQKYKLVGPNDIQCTSKGWSKQMPHCKARKCLRPGQPENGRRFGNNFTVDAEVFFFCRSAFRLFGSHKRTCQADGKWSGNLTTCDDGKTDCPIPGVPVGSTKRGKRYNIGNVIEFSCRHKYTLRGSKKRRCLANGTWSGVAPVCLDDKIPPISIVSKRLKENFAKPLMAATCSSRTANCTIKDVRGRSLKRHYENGLDLIFLLDASSSVTEEYFKLGLELFKEMVRMFGVDYSDDGTSIACVSFGTQSHLEFGLGDASVSTSAKAMERISKIKYKGGGTATRVALDMVRKVVIPMARKDSKKALMFITDGNSNIGGRPVFAARRLKRKLDVEIYVIGVGKMVKMKELRAIASFPYEEHVFRIQHPGDIQELKDSITDFSECGRDWTSHRVRVVGGRYSQAGKWPWTLLITGPTGACGASLINERWALTAAHCIVPHSPLQMNDAAFSPNKSEVFLGLTHLTKVEKQNVLAKVEDIFVHQNYIGEPTLVNDIALLKLENNPPGFQEYNRYIQRVCLPDKANFNALDLALDSPDSGGIAVGWGVIEKTTLYQLDEGLRAESLKEVFLPFVPYDICYNRTVADGRREQGWLFDQRTMFCAGNGMGVNDTCKGDSGGPFMVKRYDKDMGVYRWYQVGITSWGAGCAKEKEYAYLTRVSTYLDWITKTMMENTP